MNTLAQQLHDKATRGIELSAEEQLILDNWYAEQDRLEGELLTPKRPIPDLNKLRTQVDDALAQLSAVVQRNQELITQNEVIRRDILALQRQLSQPSIPQSV
jgi:hypothetical protein